MWIRLIMLKKNTNCSLNPIWSLFFDVLRLVCTRSSCVCYDRKQSKKIILRIKSYKIVIWSDWITNKTTVYSQTSWPRESKLLSAVEHWLLIKWIRVVYIFQDLVLSGSFTLCIFCRVASATTRFFVYHKHNINVSATQTAATSC
jgi:hypothetical protein